MHTGATTAPISSLICQERHSTVGTSPCSPMASIMKHFIFLNTPSAYLLFIGPTDSGKLPASHVFEMGFNRDFFFLSVSFSSSSELPYCVFLYNLGLWALLLFSFVRPKLFEGCLLAFSNMLFLLFSHLTSFCVFVLFCFVPQGDLFW